MSEQYRENLRRQIKIKIKDLYSFSSKELLSLDKYEDISEKISNLLIYLDDLIMDLKTDLKTQKEPPNGSHGI